MGKVWKCNEFLSRKHFSRNIGRFYDAIKEAFVKQKNLFSGKPEANVFRSNKRDKEGEVTHQHRRFILSSFKDFGMGKTSHEPQLLEEVKSFVDDLKKLNGEPVDIKPLLNISISNVIAMLEFGKQFEYSESEFIRLRERLTDAGKFIGAVSIHTFLPWIKYLYIPFWNKLRGITSTKKSKKNVRNHLHQKSEEKNYIDKSKSYFIDRYLTERNYITKNIGSERNFNDELLENLRSLFSAGTETIVGTLVWSILYSLKYPEICETVLQEINTVIGQDRDPSFSDKKNMPFTDAYLLEVYRHSSLVPFTQVHSNYEETTLFGFTIPKRSYVIGNLWAVHHDKNL